MKPSARFFCLSSKKQHGSQPPRCLLLLFLGGGGVPGPPQWLANNIPKPPLGGHSTDHLPAIGGSSCSVTFQKHRETPPMYLLLSFFFFFWGGGGCREKDKANMFYPSLRVRSLAHDIVARVRFGTDHLRRVPSQVVIHRAGDARNQRPRLSC